MPDDTHIQCDCLSVKLLRVVKWHLYEDILLTRHYHNFYLTISVYQALCTQKLK